LLLVFFAIGVIRRGQMEREGEATVRMLFVPSVEQGTLVRRGDELARFLRIDSGLTLRSQVPTSYAAVIQALGSKQADVAWVPAFTYVLANARYGAEARLQVVRAVERYAIIVTRSSAGEPADLDELAGGRIAIPATLSKGLRHVVRNALDVNAPGWTEAVVANDEEAVLWLVERREDVVAAVSSHVYSGPNDLIGDGRKLLEYERPGTLLETRTVFKTEEPEVTQAGFYYGCVLARADSGINQLSDLGGRAFAFSDETSTSGHIFARVLLQNTGVELGHVLFAGGHPNVVQAVRDGKVSGGATFYSPPSTVNSADGTLVGDARFLLLKNMNTAKDRSALLDEVRILTLTDPIPNDVCCVRAGFPDQTWRRFEASFQRFLATQEGRDAYYDLVAGVAARTCNDEDFDDFRQALNDSGVSAAKLLDAAEEKLRARTRKGNGS
jgi:phosphonate transport system substrate-binding protein